MKVALSADKKTAGIDAEIESTYKKIQDAMVAGKAATEMDDVATLHKIHAQVLGAAIDLHNASFFGLTVRHIEAAAKSAQEANDADMPDHHPV